MFVYYSQILVLVLEFGWTRYPSMIDTGSIAEVEESTREIIIIYIWRENDMLIDWAVADTFSILTL